MPLMSMAVYFAHLFSSVMVPRVPEFYRRSMTSKPPHSIFPKIEFNADKRDSLPTVVFIAGLPDNQLSPWPSEILDHFKSTCHVVLLCLPGFEDNAPMLPAWGYDFPTLIEMLHQTLLGCLPPIAEVPIKTDDDDGRKQEPTTRKKVTLITHDWGAALTLFYLHQHRNALVSRLVLLEVGSCALLTLPWREVVVVITYQLVLLIAYSLTQWIPRLFGGYFLATLLLNIFASPLAAPLWPIHAIERKHVEACADRRSYEGKIQIYYIIYQLWKSFLVNGPKKTMPKFPDCVPFLFLVSHTFSLTGLCC
jgi:pimeloyl-ACP methyl ester carboxylesterase